MAAGDRKTVDKAQEIEAGRVHPIYMGALSNTGRDTEPADQLIDILTDQFCDRTTESLEAVRKAIERRIIIRVLRKTGGNQTNAAKLLGTKRTTLGYKIKKLKIAID
jgi:transcriptional regulator with GAF, ATPase, and Fis domain